MVVMVTRQSHKLELPVRLWIPQLKGSHGKSVTSLNQLTWQSDCLINNRQQVQLLHFATMKPTRFFSILVLQFFSCLKVSVQVKKGIFRNRSIPFLFLLKNLPSLMTRMLILFVDLLRCRFNFLNLYWSRNKLLKVSPST